MHNFSENIEEMAYLAFENNMFVFYFYSTAYGMVKADICHASESKHVQQSFFGFALEWNLWFYKKTFSESFPRYLESLGCAGTVLQEKNMKCEFLWVSISFWLSTTRVRLTFKLVEVDLRLDCRQT